MKHIIFTLLITSAMAVLLPVFNLAQAAGTGICSAVNGTQNYPFTFVAPVTGASNNRPGQVVDYEWNLGREYSMNCDCSGLYFRQVFYRAIPQLPVGHADKWFKINEYLDVSLDVWIKGGRNAFMQVPFDDLSNLYTAKQLLCGEPVPEFESGSQGRIHIYLRKAFVGEVIIPQTEIVQVFATTLRGSYGPAPVSRVSMTGTVVVPQSCELDAGTVIDINFGDINANDFKGKGLKPDSVRVERRKLDFSCTNIEDSVFLDLRFEATSSPDYPSAIATTNATNNSTVGIIIKDDKGNIVTPVTGRIPIDFNHANSTGSVTIDTYPVATTENKPKEGEFSGMATLRVEFK